jgi:hypothetical protein
MPKSISDEERELLEDQLAPALREILGNEPFPTDPAELELLAATLLLPLEASDMPPAVVSGFLSEIERRGDQTAAGVLAALAVIATGDTALGALAAVERLAGAGIRSPATGKVGTATIREAARMADTDAELLVALLGRPKSRRLQVAVLGIEHEDTGGALVECMLTPPMPAADARALLRDTDGGDHPEPIATDSLVERAIAAAQRAVDLEIVLGHDAGLAMPIISRALTGDPAGLPRPETIPPWEDDDPELIVDVEADEDGYQLVVDQLLAELADWVQVTYPADGAVSRSGDFVASTMLDWKSADADADARLGRWTRIDLAEFLLDWLPREVALDEAMLPDVVDCVIAFLRFLDDRDSLSGEPLDVLEDACDELRDEFLDPSDDALPWGLVRSLSTQMLAEGVDPEDPVAFDRWMTDFNKRPTSERDAIVGGSADAMLGMAQPAGRAPKAKRSKQAAQRKSQRAARKRNRRR